jgi:hypothetical protein
MTPDEETEPESSEQPVSEAPSAPDTAAADQPLQPVEVSAVLRLCIAQLGAVAWQKMGLQPDPFTNAIHKDIAQARTAIDATAALVEKLLPQLGGQEARDYQSLLVDLRMNFLKQADTAEGS